MKCQQCGNDKTVRPYPHILMKAYIKGPKSKVKDVYVAIVKDDIVTWYYPKLDPSISTIAIPAGHVDIWIS